MTTEFRFAPLDWTPEKARATAAQEGLTPGEDHWELVRGLHEFFARYPGTEVKLRELQDALEEKFHHKGGMKYLYTLFPGGPIVQGCRLAGLRPPAGATDRGFGSVT
jgi:tRNA 2-thiouridine synthesizing protein E